MPRSSEAPVCARRHLRQHAVRVARLLLGHQLIHRDEKSGITTGGRIVEVEAYRQTDPACHAFAGRTARNASLFLPAGHLYIYRSYGLHWCVNIVCEQPDIGAAVLIRALAPTVGVDVMRVRRKPTTVADDVALLRGPGNVCRAMGLTIEQDGLDLYDKHSPVQLIRGQSVADSDIRVGPRVGITRAADWPWRLWISAERAVSSPRRGGTLFTASRSP